MSEREWQPRYVAYATAHNRTPQEQLDHDRKQYPGGNVAGFIVWIHKRWREWCRLNGKDNEAPRTAADHEAFDAWLAEQ